MRGGTELADEQIVSQRSEKLTPLQTILDDNVHRLGDVTNRTQNKAGVFVQ